MEKETHRISEKLWAFSALNLLLLLVCMFFAEVSSVQAAGLFDFQMKLAEKGNAEAQFKVGEMYETGFEVNKSMKDAEIWINKAAAQGHETAGFKLLYWDMEKNGMKGDNKSKYNELLKKAEAGNGQAMFYVGKMYAHGVGVKQNYDKALDWLNKATFIGVIEAEREAIAVRDSKQKEVAQARQAEEKRKAEEEARKAAEAKKASDAKQKQQAAERKAAEKEEKAAAAAAAAAAARKADEDARKKAESDAADKEAKRQALLKQRKEEEAKREEQFEADPCSGKSARFLSTCR